MVSESKGSNPAVTDLAIEQTVIGNAFNEVMGYPANQLATTYYFTWYDTITMTTDIIVAKP